MDLSEDGQQAVQGIRVAAKDFTESLKPQLREFMSPDNIVSLFVPFLAQRVGIEASKLKELDLQAGKIKSDLVTTMGTLANVIVALDKNKADSLAGQLMDLATRLAKMEKQLHKVSSGQGIVNSKVSSMNTSFSSKNSFSSNYNYRGRGARRGRGRGQRGRGGYRGGGSRKSSKSKSPKSQKGNLLSKEEELVFQNKKKDLKKQWHLSNDEWKKLSATERSEYVVRQRLAFREQGIARDKQMLDNLNRGMDVAK